ncbi:hypothetical protein AeMF1_021147 [Aphanomyces euteiches]|nr:hypothetical protein AeMF1_021147 [Aphanomyces euteiches]
MDRFAVVLSWPSLLLCSFIVFNLVGTPFLVHVFEKSPFDKSQRVALVTNLLSTEGNQSLSLLYASQLQFLYNTSTIPLGAMYYRDAANMVDVMRTPVSPADCPNASKLLNKVLGAVYFPPDAKQALFGCICDALSCEKVARSWRFHVTTIPISTSVLWLVPGDDGLGMPDASWTIYYAYIPHAYWPLSVAKFFFRVVVDIAILVRILRAYVIPVWHLRANLKQHRFHDASTAVRYTIELGDPSCLIASEPWFCIAFLIDIWATTEVIGQACLRMCQSDDFQAYGLAILCLGRTVWCSFGTLVALNSLRKWRPNLRLGAPLNSTVLVFLAYVVAALLPLAQSQWSAVVNIYTWLFALTATTDVEGQTASLDNVIVMLVYLLSMCALPLVVGIISKWWHQSRLQGSWSRSRIGPVTCAKSGPTLFDLSDHREGRMLSRTRKIKPPLHHSSRRSTFMISRSKSTLESQSTFRSKAAPKGVFTGDGKLADLFKLFPLVRAQATLSQRGVCCRVRGYDERNRLVDDARVHLVSLINMQQTALFRTEDSQAAVGRLQLINVEAARPQIVLQRGMSKSPWVIA